MAFMVMSEATRVAVIDDHPLLRAGVRSALTDSLEFQIVAEGENLHEALAVAQRHAPHIMIIDINVPGNGFEIIKLLRKAHPNIKVIVFTVSERSEHLAFALDLNASGYLLKGASDDDLLRCLRSVKSGKRYISPELAGHIYGGGQSGEAPASQSDAVPFTGREIEVAKLLAIGKTNKEIGDQLQISEKTVKHHMSVVMEKLGVRNRVEAALAISQKLQLE